MGGFFMDKEKEASMESYKFENYPRRPTIYAESAYLKLKSHILPTLKKTTFGGRDHENAVQHQNNILKIIYEPFVRLDVIDHISLTVVMLRLFAKTLVGKAKQWLMGYPPNSFKNWDELQPVFFKQFCPNPKFSREKVEIKSYKKEQEEPKYRAWKPTIEDRPNCTIWIDDAIKRRGESPEEPVEACHKSLKDLEEAAEELKQLVRNLKVKNRKVPCSLKNIWDNNAPSSVVTTSNNKELEALPIQERKKPIKMEKPKRKIAKEKNVTFRTDLNVVFYIDEFDEILEEEWRNSQAKKDEDEMELGEVKFDSDADVEKLGKLLGYINENEEMEEENKNFLDTADATRRAPEPRDAQVPAEEFQFIQLPENLEYPDDECNDPMLQKVNQEETKEDEKGDSDSDKSTRRVESPRVAHPLTEDFPILQFSENLDLAGESNAPVIIPTDLEGSEKEKPIKLIEEVDLSYSYHKIFMEEKDSCMEPRMIMQDNEELEEIMEEKERKEDIPMKTPPKPPDDLILATPQSNPYQSLIIFSQQLKDEYQRFLDQAKSLENCMPLIESTSIMPKLRKMKYAHVDAIDAYMEWDPMKRRIVGRKKNARAKDGYECERDKWKARNNGKSVRQKKMPAYEVREKENKASSERSKVKEGVKASPDAKGTT